MDQCRESRYNRGTDEEKDRAIETLTVKLQNRYKKKDFEMFILFTPNGSVICRIGIDFEKACFISSLVVDQFSLLQKDASVIMQEDITSINFKTKNLEFIINYSFGVYTFIAVSLVKNMMRRNRGCFLSKKMEEAIKKRLNTMGDTNITIPSGKADALSDDSSIDKSSSQFLRRTNIAVSESLTNEKVSEQHKGAIKSNTLKNEGSPEDESSDDTIISDFFEKLLYDSIEDEEICILDGDEDDSEPTNEQKNESLLEDSEEYGDYPDVVSQKGKLLEASAKILANDYTLIKCNDYSLLSTDNKFTDQNEFNSQVEIPEHHVDYCIKMLQREKWKREINANLLLQSGKNYLSPKRSFIEYQTLILQSLDVLARRADEFRKLKNNACPNDQDPESELTLKQKDGWNSYREGEKIIMVEEKDKSTGKYIYHLKNFQPQDCLFKEREEDDDEDDDGDDGDSELDK
ncbi:hypothetical protein ACOME3_000655 [Neoechinorhynchus agilis]